MTPEQMFRAFLEVWENEPKPDWQVFEKSYAINGLDELRKIIQENINSDNATLKDKILAWCQPYQELIEEIRERARGKVKVTQRLPLNPNNPLDNRYPDIPKELERRLNDDNNNTPTTAQ
jgi:hypothetical protein